MRLVEVVHAVLDIGSPKNQVGVAVLVEVTGIHGHPTTQSLSAVVEAVKVPSFCSR